MNKPALILATFITIIALILLGGLIYSWKVVGAGASGNNQAVAPGAQLSTSQEPTTGGSLQQGNQASNAITAITPDQAAQIAANFLGKGNVVRVEYTNISGGAVYKVDFTSGETIYVSLNGTVISAQMPVAPILDREHEQDDHD